MTTTDRQADRDTDTSGAEEQGEPHASCQSANPADQLPLLLCCWCCWCCCCSYQPLRRWLQSTVRASLVCQSVGSPAGQVAVPWLLTSTVCKATRAFPNTTTGGAHARHGTSSAGAGAHRDAVIIVHSSTSLQIYYDAAGFEWYSM